MTVSCLIDHAERLIMVIADGSITWEDVRAHLLQERLEEGLSYRELIDARTATPAWSSAQARDIVLLLTTFSQQSALGPTAVVVSDCFGFGMMRMLEILLDDVCLVKPFYDYDSAERWLQNSILGRT